MTVEIWIYKIRAVNSPPNLVDGDFTVKFSPPPELWFIFDCSSEHHICIRSLNLFALAACWQIEIEWFSSKLRFQWFFFCVIRWFSIKLWWQTAMTAFSHPFHQFAWRQYYTRFMNLTNWRCLRFTKNIRKLSNSFASANILHNTHKTYSNPSTNAVQIEQQFPLRTDIYFS